MSFDFEISQTVAPRSSEAVLHDIRELMGPSSLVEPLLELVREIEEGAWRAGASEGYDHGYQDAVDK